jgi:hypothetical protein
MPRFHAKYPKNTDTNSTPTGSLMTNVLENRTDILEIIGRLLPEQ